VPRQFYLCQRLIETLSGALKISRHAKKRRTEHLKCSIRHSLNPKKRNQRLAERVDPEVPATIPPTTAPTAITIRATAPPLNALFFLAEPDEARTAFALEAIESPAAGLADAAIAGATANDAVATVKAILERDIDQLLF